MGRVLALLVALALVGCGGGPSAQVSPEQVVDAFRAADLEVGEVKEMAVPDDWGLLPMGEEGLHFLLPSLCEDCGGRAMLFEDEEQANRVKAYYDGLDDASAMLFTWAFQRGRLVVQLNGDLPEERARQYEEVLDNLP